MAEHKPTTSLFSAAQLPGRAQQKKATTLAAVEHFCLNFPTVSLGIAFDLQLCRAGKKRLDNRISVTISKVIHAAHQALASAPAIQVGNAKRVDRLCPESVVSETLALLRHVTTVVFIDRPSTMCTYRLVTTVQYQFGSRVQIWVTSAVRIWLVRAVTAPNQLHAKHQS